MIIKPDIMFSEIRISPHYSRGEGGVCVCACVCVCVCVGGGGGGGVVVKIRFRGGAYSRLGA